MISCNNEKLNFHVRFLCQGKVVNRYFHSNVHGKSRAVDLLDCIENLTLSLKFMLQLSMDGPNFNWSLFHKVQDHMKLNHGGRTLLNIGSCGLHITHNAIRKAFKVAGLNILNFLSALATLFQDVPARRAYYSRVTKSDMYPLPHCGHQWVENVRVAIRANEMISSLIQYMAAGCCSEEGGDTPRNFILYSC